MVNSSFRDLSIKHKIYRGLIVSLCFFWIAIIILLLFPQNQYRAGNVFFGDFPALYNLRIAQAFFTGASYPLIGSAPVFAHYQLSRTYFIEGDLYQALVEAQNELKLHPENSRTFYILGLTYGYMNQEEKAINAFSKFIDAYPDSWAARNDKAWLQFRIGDIEGALETIEPVSHLDNPWVLNTYGTLLLNSGQLQESKEVLLHALNIVQKLTADDWGRAYPGNDPRIYEVGLGEMRASIEDNLRILDATLLSTSDTL